MFFSYIKYLWSNNKTIFYKLFLILLIGSCSQFFLPFLTQATVDKGIKNNDLTIVQLILLGQILLFLGQIISNLYRNWLLLYMGSSLSLKIIEDYLSKLLKTPISFFETTSTGDIMQRIYDIRKIEFFLTSTALTALFSMAYIIVYSIVLLFYNYILFVIIIITSIVPVYLIKFSNKKRKYIDKLQFTANSKNQNQILQIINGVKDIKANNAEILKLKNWEHNYQLLKSAKLKSLLSVQFFQSSLTFITYIKNIFITYYSATLVINNELSLGEMMAIVFITGQLNSPVEQLLNFSQYYLEAKLSLNRITKFNTIKSFEDFYIEPSNKFQIGDINISNLSFLYPNSKDTRALIDISCQIKRNEFTAIVGKSGSGKSTLIKILLKYYDEYKGEINIENTDFTKINTSEWRHHINSVLADGFIFTDTILNNVALENKINFTRVKEVCKITNIDDFISSLEKNYNTIIGQDEKKLSDGQKQRILIARALYKNPSYIFLDEVTNALDSINELEVISNLKKLKSNTTIICVSHKLSTVKDADNIIVLDEGRLVEQGKHQQLMSDKKFYYNLFKNQLN